MNEGTIALIVTIIGVTVGATWKISDILSKIYVSMEKIRNKVDDHDEIINDHIDVIKDHEHRIIKLEGK